MMRAKVIVAAGLLLSLTSAGGLTAALAQSAPATAPAASAPAASAPATPDATPPAAPAAPATPDATQSQAPATAPATAPAATPDASTPAATAPVAPPVAATTTVSNPYGLDVLITKAIAQTRILSQARQVEGTFWKQPTVQQATASMQKGSPFQYIAQTGVESLERHNDLLDKIDIHTFAESSIQDGVESVQSRMQDGLALLATVGSTAPFVGLFGTVWGIYHALTAIGIAGQASIDKVAGPVGESLIMTAIGLAVAVPAVLGYNFLVRRNKRVVELSRKFGRKLLFVLLSSAPATRQV
jgi:biopolymer transport protein ExbB